MQVAPGEKILILKVVLRELRKLMRRIAEILKRKHTD
jgi:hypothetical protein